MPRSNERLLSPRVSVIVPCFDVERYVGQCLNSILSQTLSDIEVICVNDGSNDATLSILYDWARKDARVRVIDKRNSGYGHSVNMGMTESRGEYVGIVEPDDFIRPDMYEVLYDAARSYQLDVVRCGYWWYLEHSEESREIKFDNIPKNCVLNPVKQCLATLTQQPSVWNNLYRRQWLLDNRIRFLETSGASYQDISFCFKAYCLARRFMMLDQAYLFYRADNAASSINSTGKMFCVCDELAEIEHFLDLRPDLKQLVGGVLSAVQFRAYRWNFNRLRKSDKYVFLQRWSRELKRYIKTEMIDWHWFSRREIKHLIIIAYMPWLYRWRSKNI